MSKRLRDLSDDGHKYRQINEDYRYMIDTGTSHEDALGRLCLTAAEWKTIRNKVQKRESRARG